MSEYLVIGMLTRPFEMWVTARSPEEAHAKALADQYVTETEGTVLQRQVMRVVLRGGGTSERDQPQ